jgi:hypothetical protein
LPVIHLHFSSSSFSIVPTTVVNRNTAIRVRAGTQNSRPVGFLL